MAIEIMKRIMIGLISAIAALLISAVVALGLGMGKQRTPGARLAHYLVVRGWEKSPGPIGYTLQITFWADTLLFFAVLCVFFGTWSYIRRQRIGHGESHAPHSDVR